METKKLNYSSAIANEAREGTCEERTPAAEGACTGGRKCVHLCGKKRKRFIAMRIVGQCHERLIQHLPFDQRSWRKFQPDRAEESSIVILRVGFRTKQRPCPPILFGELCILYKRIVPCRNDLYAN